MTSGLHQIEEDRSTEYRGAWLIPAILSLASALAAWHEYGEMVEWLADGGSRFLNTVASLAYKTFGFWGPIGVYIVSALLFGGIAIAMAMMERRQIGQKKITTLPAKPSDSA